MKKLSGGKAAFVNFFASRMPRPSEDEFAIYDPITTYLIGCALKYGKRFRLEADTPFESITTLAFDIEVKSGNRFPDASREEDRIFAISWAVRRPGCNVESGVAAGDDERKLLEEFFAVIERVAPDVLVGHNIFGFDIPYIIKRAAFCGVDAFAGRKIRTFRKKKRLAERSIFVDVYRIEGMHVIDTMILAQMWDVYARSLASYGLKDIAKALGISSEDRTIVERASIYEHYQRDPRTVIKYAQEDAVESLLLFEFLAPPYWELQKIVPTDFIGAIMGGSGQLFELMLVADYVERGVGLPERLPHRKQEWGGYVDVFTRGVVRGAHHIDVSSLYPSIMLRFSVAPKNDDLSAFQHRLRVLTESRLELKRLAKETGKKSYEAQSAAMKILINSAYGMMGYAGAYFRDAESADVVARMGQRIIQSIIRYVKEAGGRPILCDTDGLIYQGRADMARYVQRRLDEEYGGIKIDYEGYYDAVLVYKKKNYVIRKANGEVTYKGGLFRSRGWEGFKENMIKGVVEALLDGDLDRAERVIEEYEGRLLGGALTAKEIGISATINDLTKTNLPHVAAARKRRDVKTGDKVTYYIKRVPRVALHKLKAHEAAEPIENFAGDYHVEYYYKKRFLPIAQTLEELIKIEREKCTAASHSSE